jgi:hypothetical protein
MKKYLWFFAIASIAILSAVPAQAQATRTWISGVGDDANPCSRTAPCKTFAGAISKTATGGEINLLDPNGAGTLTITKAISVISQVEGGALASGVNGFIINTPAGAKVLLQGLDIEGLNGGTNPPGINGVHIISASKVTIQNCSIRNFSGNGVNIVGPAGTRVVIADSYIYGNAGGVNIQGNGVGVANVAVMMRCVLDNNTNFAAQITNTCVLFVGGSKLLGSPAAFAFAPVAGGTVTSFGDNSLQGTGLPTTTPGNK